MHPMLNVAVRAARQGRDLSGLRVGVIAELDGGDAYHQRVVSPFHPPLAVLARLAD